MDHTAAIATSVDQAIAGSRRSLDAGDPRGALDVLRAACGATVSTSDDDAGRLHDDAPLYEEMVRVRHLGAVALDDATRSGGAPAPAPNPATAAPTSPSTHGEVGIVEVPGADLDPTILADALRDHGCLLVREVIPRTIAEELLALARRAVAESERAREGAGRAETSPWFAPFEAHERYGFGEMERAFTRFGGGLLTAESPLVLHRLIEEFEAAGVGELLEAHFGERPVLSAKKSTLRSADSTSPAGWHQDGGFLGSGTRAVNMWLALTPCGIDAPSIDIFDRSFDHLVEQGPDAAFSWSVGQSVVDELGMDRVHRPVFEPGDAMFFDHLSLHRTGVDPSMTAERMAVETWFFAPSTYPEGQVPLLFRP